jgi:pimeloyl-ACP methyl ester carboxylesterase
LVLLLADWGMKLLGWLWENIVLNVIKLVILVFFFILIALVTIILLLFTSFLGLVFLPIMLILGGSVHYDFLSLGLELRGFIIWFEGIFGWAYSSFLGIDLPTITIQHRLNEEIQSSITLSLSESSQQPNSITSIARNIINPSSVAGNDKAISPLELSSVESLQSNYQKNPTTSYQKDRLPNNRTLLLVHGYNGAGSQFQDFYTNPYIRNYYDKIVPIDCYGKIPSSNYSYSLGAFSNLTNGFSTESPIENIAGALKNFILNENNTELFSNKTVDIISHSMGGLIVRYMIKEFYEEIANITTFDDVLTIATPNHGTQLMVGLWNLIFIIYVALGIISIWFPLVLIGLAIAVFVISYLLDRFLDEEASEMHPSSSFISC